MLRCPCIYPLLYFVKRFLRMSLVNIASSCKIIHIHSVFIVCNIKFSFTFRFYPFATKGNKQMPWPNRFDDLEKDNFMYAAILNTWFRICKDGCMQIQCLRLIHIICINLSFTTMRIIVKSTLCINDITVITHLAKYRKTLVNRE